MNGFRDSFDFSSDADGVFGPSRAEQVAWRGVSMLLVLAFALQVGMGYARSDASFRDSLGQPTFVRALAQTLTTTVARPTRNTREVPVRQASPVRPVSLDSLAKAGSSAGDAVHPRQPRPELIALPPPLA
ncbi:MAG: hypothetical protein K2Y21_13165 [Phycisphaerales bacterium]|nr:hypothetical protein [Phycisphaerales bacterium]